MDEKTREHPNNTDLSIVRELPIDCGVVGGLLVKAVRIHIGQVCAQLSW